MNTLGCHHENAICTTRTPDIWSEDGATILQHFDLKPECYPAQVALDMSRSRPDTPRGMGWMSKVSNLVGKSTGRRGKCENSKFLSWSERSATQFWRGGAYIWTKIATLCVLG